MATIVRKARQFKKIFNKEERLVIVLGSLVVIFTIVLGFIGLAYLMQKYVEFTAPYMLKALNTIIGALFEGWTWL